MTGSVYLLEYVGGDLFKIGYSRHIEVRVRALQTSSPVSLELRWSHAGTLELERKLHREFSSYRKHGEWFDFGRLDAVEMTSAATAKFLGSLGPGRHAPCGSGYAPIDGEKLRLARELIGLNQGQLSAKSGVSQPYISQLENGSRQYMSAPTYGFLRAALGITDPQALMPDRPDTP